jgi:penicillin amidase
VNPAPKPDDRPLGNDVNFTTETVEMDGLTGPVDVVRDAFGMIHIYANDPADAVRVEGYQVARDRTVQLELIRRFSEGRTAEVFGQVSPSLIDNDISQRTLGLTRTSQKVYDALPTDGDERKWLNAFADGVSQLYARIRSGDYDLPKTIVGFQRDFLTDWTGVDSLVIARYQAQNLSFDAGDDVNLSAFFDAVHTQFAATQMDPQRKRRAGIGLDLIRFAPVDPTTNLMGFPNDTMHTLDWTPSLPPSTFRPNRTLLDDARAWTNSISASEIFFGDRTARGSNNWMVNPSKSATGHAMVASDPHLSLSSPAVFWMVHLDVHAKPGADNSKDLNTAGLAFPGIPGIILGFNEHVAWGATTADYDVSDVYQETMTQDGANVVYKGANVPIQKIRETIKVQNSPQIDYDVLYVPHHGPIIPNVVNHAIVAPDPQKGALTYRWTGLDPSTELTFVMKLMYAKNVEDVRGAVKYFQVGAQNWVSADTDGNTFWSTQSRIPMRDPRALQWDPKTQTGTMPLLVLPGDGTCEWTGDMDEAYIPHLKNPPEGFLATANADQVGVSLDNDPTNDKLPNGAPGYLGNFGDGLRVGRIYQRLRAAPKPMSTDDLASIQADVKSPYGSRLAPKLIEMIDHAEQERTTPGTHPDLAALVASARYMSANVGELKSWLASWGTDSDYFSESGMSPDDNTPVADTKLATASKAALVFNSWMTRMGQLTFDDEMKILAGTPQPVTYPRALWWLLTTPPAMLGTYDMAVGDSALFDDISTPAVETRDERGITSLLDAVDMIGARLGGDRNQWRWGKLHTLRHDALVSLWSALSIPPPNDPVFPIGYPRHGDISTIDVANFGTRPGDFSMMPFNYGSGPTQRFVIEMDPAGVKARNALPGGNVWDTASPYFKNDDELWRRNQNHPVWLARKDVIMDAKERITYVPRKK